MASHPPFNVELAGVVKAVPSGDSIVVLKPSSSTGGPPPELRIYLASVRAPVLGRIDGDSADEPGSFAAREYLRKAVIGKRVLFTLEYAVAALGNRLMASVVEAPKSTGMPKGENLAVEMVHKGLVRVRRPNDPKEQRSSAYDDLCAAEDDAKSRRLGIHAEDGGIGMIPKRQLGTSTLDAHFLVDECKGHVLQGVCEYVMNGSTLKIYLRDVPGNLGDRVVQVSLSGIQCPGFRKAEGTEVFKPAPFALNAKYVTEARLLHRDVNVSIEGLDRNQMVCATVLDPSCNTYVGEELLKAGFAKTASWSIEFTPRAPSLRAAERTARDSRISLWKCFVQSKNPYSHFVGKCIEVINGDLIAVLDNSSREVKRVYLSSVRAPRYEPIKDRNVAQTGPACNARETLRKKLIGRSVVVKVDYVKQPSESSVRKEPMVFATVGRENDERNTDVALPLIDDGLLTVIRHRGEEDRSPNYELYLEREKVASEARKGIHKSVESENGSGSFMRINNLTGQDAKKRSREVAPSLARASPHTGLVEHVTSGSRFRVFLPKQAMLVTIALRAIRTPQPSRKSYLADGTANVDSAEEPYGDESLAFAREMFLQRDVEVTIVSADRSGAFLGNMYVISSKGEREDVSKLILERGMGYIHEMFDPKELGASGLVSAESSARSMKLGIWKDYKEPDVNGSSTSKALSSEGTPRKVIKAVVCEVASDGRIFVQNLDNEKNILDIQEELQMLKLGDESPPPLAGLKPGDVVAAKFSADNAFYRAKVLSKADKNALVRYIDYGNEETVSFEDVRSIKSSMRLNSAPAGATEVCLADIVVPGPSENFGGDSTEYIREIISGKTVEVAVRGSQGSNTVVGDILVPMLNVSNGTSGSTSAPQAQRSLTETLLESGLVRIIRKSDKASRAAFGRLSEFEKRGQATRDYLWIYGDVYDSDCDDDEEVKLRRRSRR